jgi:hypothetical protein
MFIFREPNQLEYSVERQKETDRRLCRSWWALLTSGTKVNRMCIWFDARTEIVNSCQTLHSSRVPDRNLRGATGFQIMYKIEYFEV